jgi:CYTH domain-containing protein
MGVEIERKFLLHRLPGPEVLGPGTELRQGYLAEEGDVEVRVRIAAGEAALTVKAGRGRSRTEVEVPVALAEAEDLWPHTVGRRIAKVRHRVDVGDLVAEVDVYRGDLDGLVVVEVELPDEATSDGFVPPAWFGPEVTGDPAWSNAALARSGRPPDPAG